MATYHRSLIYKYSNDSLGEKRNLCLSAISDIRSAIKDHASLWMLAEYNSRDAQGNVLDLSKRKTEYQYKDRQTGKEVSGTCQATITKEEADKYTYENMIPGNDGWNPRIMMEKLGSPRSLVYQQGTLKWNPVKNAIGYIVYDGEQILGTTTDTSFPVSEVNYALKVSAVNQYGTQGKKGVL